ncbi:uncharacterized protein T551_02024 [Pneumocystis jirovecii RU7]|uniref:Uncharacterized protein n=1 Tax=Pneumocystis jirovecii (strain RU7) TaxID=1408657 RepID=A0A0W4ZNY8_PNEJ7|nr:uncharacterized protein T551_02024 [Pneumocystis jirovecii RU7]KTW30080.1 hypothetical protein T551_02024 [Pneumocystis jirovecii RU7]
MTFSCGFDCIFSAFLKLFQYLKQLSYRLQTLSLSPLQSLLRAYPDLTSIFLLLIILYISLYTLGRAFRKFKIFLRIVFFLAILISIIYTLLNGVSAAQAKFNNIKAYVRETAFLLIDKKHARKNRR